MKKRIWLTMSFLFVITGATSCVFNILLEGAYPVATFFSGGLFTALVYGLFTSILCICKNDLKALTKVFLNFVEVFCFFVTIGYNSVILTQKIPVWWMYLVWLALATIIGYKSYMDWKKFDF